MEPESTGSFSQQPTSAGASSSFDEELGWFLSELRLEHYLEPARRWCATMGAGFLHEIVTQELADELQLKPLERKRFLFAGQQLRDCAAGGDEGGDDEDDPTKASSSTAVPHQGMRVSEKGRAKNHPPAAASSTRQAAADDTRTRQPQGCQGELTQAPATPGAATPVLLASAATQTPHRDRSSYDNSSSSRGRSRSPPKYYDPRAGGGQAPQPILIDLDSSTDEADRSLARELEGLDLTDKNPHRSTSTRERETRNQWLFESGGASPGPRKSGKSDFSTTQALPQHRGDEPTSSSAEDERGGVTEEQEKDRYYETIGLGAPQFPKIHHRPRTLWARGVRGGGAPSSDHARAGPSSTNTQPYSKQLARPSGPHYPIVAQAERLQKTARDVAAAFDEKFDEGDEGDDFHLQNPEVHPSNPWAAPGGHEDKPLQFPTLGAIPDRVICTWCQAPIETQKAQPYNFGYDEMEEKFYCLPCFGFGRGSGVGTAAPAIVVPATTAAAAAGGPGTSSQGGPPGGAGACTLKDYARKHIASLGMSVRPDPDAEYLNTPEDLYRVIQKYQPEIALQLTQLAVGGELSLEEINYLHARNRLVDMMLQYLHAGGGALQENAGP